MNFNDGKLVINWITARKNVTCLADEFMCNQSRYCIRSIYYCDRIEHCPNDFSDEPENCFVQQKESLLFPPMMQITSFVVSIVVLAVFITICLFCRIRSIRRKAKLKHNPQQFNGPPIYYKYSPANSMDYLGKAIKLYF